MGTVEIIKILELAAKYGLPAVQTAIEAWDKDTITVQDIEKLGESMKKPEEYFE